MGELCGVSYPGLTEVIQAPSMEDKRDHDHDHGDVPPDIQAGCHDDNVDSDSNATEDSALKQTDNGPGGGIPLRRLPPVTLARSEPACQKPKPGSQETWRRSKKKLSFSADADPPPGPDTWKGAIYQYCQETSLHGLRQITEPQRYIVRRLLWVVLLLLGVGLFGYQMIQAIAYYMTWPVSVNINIKYNESIRFPAVTLCNQNAFRMTAALFYDHYNLTTEFYMNQHDGFGHSHPPVNLSAYPGAAEHHITDFYTLTAHRQQEFIVECSWDGSPCHADDFVVTLTDFGVCYTFNSGLRGDEIKRATHTGSQSGLKLRLNIEQYEYMKGPNSGAGIKLHLHNQGDVAMVKDHGIAVAPGTHAFVAVNLIEIHNLEPPHGECSRDVTLEYYKHYSKASCMMDCLQRHVIERCDCRDFYMPLGNSTFPMCTLEEYLTCFVPAQEEFKDQKTTLCDCPIPCHVTVLQPSVSYGSTSNFDTEALLHSSSSQELRENFVRAREASQRVNKDALGKNRKLIDNFTDIVVRFSWIFGAWNASLDRSKSNIDGIYAEFHKRHDFHSRMGLQKMKYIIRNEFVRGWEVAEERGVDYVANNFFNVIDSVDRFIQFANKSSSQSTREAAWFAVQNILEGRRELALRSLDNISEAVTSFTEGRRLVNYKPAIDERYDKAYAALSVLAGKYFLSIESYHDGIKKSLHSFTESLDTLLAIGQQFAQNKTLDNELLQTVKQQFITASKGYNYDLFRFSDRVVHGSLDRVEKKIDEFESAWEDVGKTCNEMRVVLVDTQDMINRIQGPWQGLQKAASDARAYLDYPSMMKTPLAEAAKSNLGVFTDTIQIFLRDLRSNARAQTEKWYNLDNSIRIFWQKIIFDTSLDAFYGLVHSDFQSFLKAESTEEKMKNAELLYKMLEDQLYVNPQLYSPGDILNLTTTDLMVRLNADVHTLDLDVVLKYIRGNFTQYYWDGDLLKWLGNSSDEVLFEVVDDFMQDLDEFLEGNKIGANFYSENFLRLDIYLKDLSYQQIIQQEDYDLQKLLSDIGGSIGLFVGASVLSLFEFMDVVCLHSATRRR